MFGDVVMGVDAQALRGRHHAEEGARWEPSSTPTSSADDLKDLTVRFKAILQEEAGE